MKTRSMLLILLTSAAMLISSVTAAAQGAAVTLAATSKPNVAILIFDGVQIIDYTGPYEVLGSWKRRNVYTVAEKAAPVTTNMGMRVIPNYTFENSPRPDILVIPGGGNSTPGANGRGVGAQLNNENIVRWIRDTSERSQFVLSVCNGAFLIARAGLLDGLEATTTAGMIELLKTVAPRTRVVADRRFVDNGKVITTAGLSSGIDGALHLIEKMDGRGWAQFIARSIEYNWQPASGYARAALADMKLPDSIYAPIFPSGAPVSLLGGPEAWEEQWSVPLPAGATPKDVLKSINDIWAAEKNWISLKEDRVDSWDMSVWRFTDQTGKSWIATASVESSSTKSGHALVTLRIVSASTLSDPRLAKGTCLNADN